MMTQSKCQRDVKQQKCSYAYGASFPWYSHFGKQFNIFLLKLDKCMTSGPGTSLLGLHLAAVHAYLNQDRCTETFRAAALIKPGLDTARVHQQRHTAGGTSGDKTAQWSTIYQRQQQAQREAMTRVSLGGFMLTKFCVR